MKCEEFLRRLVEYEDGVLEGEICHEIERHRRECGDCADLQHDLSDLSRLCHECGAPRLPEAVRQRIAARLKS